MDALLLEEHTGLGYASTDHGIDTAGQVVPVAVRQRTGVAEVSHFAAIRDTFSLAGRTNNLTLVIRR
jgi:hypothetical protein